MTVIGDYFKCRKVELFNDWIDEVDGGCLGVFVMDFECSDPRRVINGCVLEAPHFLAVFSPEGQKLNIDLDLMAGHLFVVSFDVQLAHPCASWKPIKAIAP